ncbi:MAG: CHASE2 domain-containing protein [Spirochaetia bacterium]
MSKRQNEQNKYLLIAVVAAILVALAGLLPQFRALERTAYDQLLGMRKPVEERSDIILLDIDDLAIAQVGMWPWSRHVVADGLIVARELGLNYALFDIEYVDRSPRGVDSELLENEIPLAFAEEFGLLRDNIESLFGALQSGMIPLEEAEEFVLELVDLTDQSRAELLSLVRSIARDNDEYLGQSARLFGNVFYTNTMLPDDVGLISVSEEHRDYVLNEIALSNVTGALDTLPVAADIQPTLPPIATRAAGAGFPNVVVDQDGVRRRIELLAIHEDRPFAQLAFRPLLDWLGNPDIEVRPGAFILRDAQHPERGIGDIRIPRSFDGRMLITWPPKEYADSFTHVSFNDLVVHDLYEEDLLYNLVAMEDAGFLSFHDSGEDLLPAYTHGQRLRDRAMAGGDRELMDEYEEVREFFFARLARFFESDAEERLLGELNRVLESEDLPDHVRQDYEAILEDAPLFFEATGAIATNLIELRERLQSTFDGAFAVIGHTSISTTDIGVNPFDEQYINVGIHPAVANTILAGDFLVELPPWYGMVLGLILSFVVALLIRGATPKRAIIVGLLFLIAVIVGVSAFFVFTGMFLSVFTPAMAVFLSFFGISLVKFLRAEGEKSFLRSAFSRYLSADVISQIIEDPERLSLGGDSKVLTAMFTDVKGFSTIAEKMSPGDLVRLLNEYLTGMSNIVLDLYGTIDKYEGDAIIAFFGAPLPQEDHAERSCIAAVRMKAAEIELNKRFAETEIAPGELHTRIGINTGEMVVGNMGTPQKMDYTIMGHAVNLAARLEGVNKQYGTWILTGDATLMDNNAGEQVLSRRLDRVRVVGVNEPIRLHEVMYERSAARPEDFELVEMFEDGLNLFEQRNWKDAGLRFQQALRLRPADGPSTVFRDRCKTYLKKGPADDWDGVYNLTSK